MTNRIPWTSRTFAFDTPPALHPESIERLRGTAARIEEAIDGLDRQRLTRRLGDTWSIQENIGHLADLETLFSGRLDDFETGVSQ